ncbi:LOW QUALITY PROTEIN: hypothetical protein Fmac_012166 [Flemingia macrophylla]|uniref:Receptor-like protein 12 n=1 Tax=Flemingia macrophylla TaxID=520843 RepID=A0ABD1MPK0_9FABA
MSRCNLLGPLDPSLATLENLSVIVLDGNNLSSSVPETFAHFKHLTILSLHRCGLTGTFPHKIFNVGTLSLIDISENYNLHGFFPEFPMNGSLQTFWTSFVGALPHSIGNIRHLDEFGLSYCGFNGIIPNSLSNLTELSYLDLSNNKFIGTIPSSQFEGLHNLVFVNLDNNYFTGSIPSSFFTLRSLQLLWLSNNKFSQLDDLINVTSSRLELLHICSNDLFGSVPSSLFTLPHLKEIYLSDNQFSRLDEFINVASSILEFLALDCNSFNRSTQLNKLSEFRNFTEIDLSYNNVSANVNFINVEPPFFSSLELLVLASCDLRNFPGFLRNLSTLVALDISNNHIQGKVPNWIWKMPNLLFLNLSHNLLTELEGPLQYITSRLHFLDLHHNKLQGPVPIFSGNATYLDFSGNKFSSSIPGDIISGRIPSCLMKMSKNFEVLNLKNNNLSGSIPDTIQPCCALWTINLHGNLLDGPIPKSIVNCSKLEVLDLGSNQIIGGFPCLLKEISQLRILVLWKNKFQGPLRCLKANKATWEMLQILDIAFNNFSGKLAGSFLTTWKKYMMHNEHLAESKFIEKEIGLGGQHYQDSVTINNKGQEMELVKILTIYTSIGFSSNHFEGPIPEKLMDFNELTILNLSNNALSGKIPSSIGNLIQLESLDLSQNSLSGEISMQLVSLSFLEYLNLSFNHLVGKIPTGTQLQSFPASSFEGNDGLYGPPLPSIENRNGTEPGMLPQRKCGRLACTVDWNFISVELGLVFGHGIVFGPLLIWKGWRIRDIKLSHVN